MQRTRRTLELCEQPDVSEQEGLEKGKIMHDVFNPFPSHSDKESYSRADLKEEVAEYLSSNWIDEVVGDREMELRAHDIIEEIRTLREKISGLFEELGQINRKKLTNSLFGDIQVHNEKKHKALPKSIKSWDADKLLNALDKVMIGLPAQSEISKIVEAEFQSRITNNFKYIGVSDISITNGESLHSIGDKKFICRQYKIVNFFDNNGNCRASLECEPDKLADVNKCYLFPADEFKAYVETSYEFAEWREIRDRAIR